jgi:hypothetical protein
MSYLDGKENHGKPQSGYLATRYRLIKEHRSKNMVSHHHRIIGNQELTT